MNVTLNPSVLKSVKKSAVTIDPVFQTNKATETSLSKTLHGFYKDQNTMDTTFHNKRMSELIKAPAEG